ncbi:6-phosphofructokinase, partial [Candidatus Woesearchaeota archaeon]|nr:6-phosphofructokinase [Candidatus Woesearchaeota archaeon]
MERVKTIALGQGGGPTPVINDEIAGALYEAKKNGIRVLGLRNGVEGLLYANVKGNVVDLTNIDSYELRQGPGAILGSTRIKIKKDRDEEIIAALKRNMKALKIDSIAYFGGNDSSDVLAALGVGIHGSKTVDNDLMEADHTPGYGSNSLFNAIALKHAYMDVRSFGTVGNVITKEGRMVKGVKFAAPVMVYQVMGRASGWLGMSAAFAKVNPHGDLVEEMPPDIVWTKETPFEEDRFITAVLDSIKEKGRAIIVAGEDLTDKNSGLSLSEAYGNAAKDSHGNIEHSRSGSFSTADFLSQFVAKKVREKVSIIKAKETPLVPQHVQRCFVKSKVDAAEAFEVGRECVRAIVEGD